MLLETLDVTQRMSLALRLQRERLAELQLRKKIREDVAMGRQAKDLLKSCEDAKQNIRPANGKICPDGLAILQADGHTRPLNEHFPNVRRPAIRRAQQVVNKLVELGYVSDKGLTVLAESAEG